MKYFHFFVYTYIEKHFLRKKNVQYKVYFLSNYLKVNILKINNENAPHYKLMLIYVDLYA